MSDFISNRPDGKSDLYTYAPPAPVTENESSVQESANRIPPSPQAQLTPSAAPSFSPPPPWDHFSYMPPTAPPPTAPPANPLSTTSMIMGIVTWGGLILCCGCFSPVTAILAIIFAIVSRTNKKMNGRAVAGLVLGIVFLCLFFMLLLLLITGSVFEVQTDLGEESVISLLLHLPL